MWLIYNIIQLFLLPFFVLALPLILLLRPAKSRNFFQRLGIGLIPAAIEPETPVIWIHALSVGEVLSVYPLVQALRRKRPDAVIVFSATTASGRELAGRRITPLGVDVISSPLDILPVVLRFLKRIRPDLFILVETDFWPNLIYSLHYQKIPALLVNGRISQKSMQSYNRFSFFFNPMFRRFSKICMQTAEDADNMLSLGLDREVIQTPGNLKYALAETATDSIRKSVLQAANEHLLLLCGSTHPGEETILLDVFCILKDSYQDIHLAIAPRDISRAKEIGASAHDKGLKVGYYSTDTHAETDCLVIDTIGDLQNLYPVADIAFIGGSMVNLGGHNPLEAVRHGVPTVFGPYMDNFSEISKELLDHEASFQVQDKDSLRHVLEQLIVSYSFRRKTGEKGAACFRQHQDVITNHLAIIEKYL